MFELLDSKAFMKKGYIGSIECWCSSWYLAYYLQTNTIEQWPKPLVKRILVRPCVFSLLIKGSYIDNWGDLLGEPKSSSGNPTNIFGKQWIDSEKRTNIGEPYKQAVEKCKSVVDRCCLGPLEQSQVGRSMNTRGLPWGHQKSGVLVTVGTKGVAPSCWDRFGTWPKELRENSESAADMLLSKVGTLWALFL